MWFPVVMYRCESWTLKKAEHQSIDAFELWCWRRLLRVPWTARRSNQSTIREINPEYSLDVQMLKLKLQYFGYLIWGSDSLWPHESQHARPPCPSPTPGVHPDSSPWSQWCHPAISSSVVPFSSCPQSPQHQSLFQWVNSSHEVAKVLEFQL